MTLRFTKLALLIFGLGILAGLVVVAGEFPAWERPAAALMALGIVGVPIGVFADGHGFAVIAWLAARLRRDDKAKRRGKARAPARRRKKPARPSARPTPRKRSPRPSR